MGITAPHGRRRKNAPISAIRCLAHFAPSEVPMAGSEPKVSPTKSRFPAETDSWGEWIAPIIAFILVAGILLALVGAIFAPQ